MSTVSQVAGQALAQVATAVLSKFRRKWLERQAGNRVFISNGREAARVEALEAARQSELELEKAAHDRRNAEQARLLQEEAERAKAERAKTTQTSTAPPSDPVPPA